MRNNSLFKFDNASVMMTMDENPQCSFQILRPVGKKQRFGIGSTVTAKSGTIPLKIKVYVVFLASSIHTCYFIYK